MPGSYLSRKQGDKNNSCMLFPFFSDASSGTLFSQINELRTDMEFLRAKVAVLSDDVVSFYIKFCPWSCSQKKTYFVPFVTINISGIA